MKKGDIVLYFKTQIIDGLFCRRSISSYTPGDGLLIGSYNVQVRAVEPIDSSSQRWHAPRKYAKTNTSNLGAEINAETKELKFELSWDGEDPSEPFVEKF